MALVSMFFASIYGYLQYRAPTFFTNGVSDRSFISLLIPTVLLSLFFFDDRRYLKSQGLIGVVSILGTLLFLMGLVNFPFVREALAPGDSIFKTIPDVSIVACLLFSVSRLLSKQESGQRLRMLIFFSLVPTLYVLSFRGIPNPSINLSSLTAIGFSCQSALLLYGTFLQYWEKVYIDELTGIPNRRALDEQLVKLKKEYSLVMADIDHFKHFNDTYGHDQGDHVLRFVATHLKENSKAKVFRYGGEEFVLIYQGWNKENASQDADETRKKLSKKQFHFREDKRSSSSAESQSEVRITLSLGVSSNEDAKSNPQEVIRNADSAMYQAKNEGRDRVIIWR